LAAKLPYRWQYEIKRIYYAIQIKRGVFGSAEAEYKLLPQFIRPGDWVIDIGANAGPYTKRLSELVGRQGRVIAFEPVPATFSLLAANAQLFAHANVTMVNAAVSDKTDVVGMTIPRFPTGLTNYYEARLSPAAGSQLTVLTLSVDSLGLSQRVALVKIDAEGHEAFVLSGMQRLLSDHHPILIVETGSDEVIAGLTAMGYLPERLPGSANVMFRPCA
jgi:FkbM family methyltransferase